MELKRIVASSSSLLEQTPPPSLREILAAYRARGDGDRDMLLSMLHAKTAEDQRLASVYNLQRSMIELYQVAPEHVQSSSSRTANGNYHYPTPSFTQSPHPYEQRTSRQTQRKSRSRSPTHLHGHIQSIRDVPMSHHSEHPRKRHRSSHSPHSSYTGAYESSHPSSQHEQFPPSPYSSDRSDSAEYSPRSRTSMAIGSLLSSGPSREANGDNTITQERE